MPKDETLDYKTDMAIAYTFFNKGMVLLLDGGALSENKHIDFIKVSMMKFQAP